MRRGQTAISHLKNNLEAKLFASKLLITVFAAAFTC